jgi:hypothetical protein
LQSATIALQAAAHPFAFVGCAQHARSVKPAIASVHET